MLRLAADFTGFVAGRMTLIQRGGRTFGTKASNAQAAGASGVVIFNEGNPVDRLPRREVLWRRPLPNPVSPP